MMKVEEKDTVFKSSLGNPKPTKETSFTFLCSDSLFLRTRLLFVFLWIWYLSDGLLNRRKGNDTKKSCLEGILSFGKEYTKNTIGNNRNKLSRFTFEKGHERFPFKNYFL